MLSTAIIFSDGMVLQRQKKIKVWGETDSTGPVNVSLIDPGTGSELGSAETTAISDGKWAVTLSPQEANTGLQMTITDHLETIIVKDVCIGEVWIAGGQSNMAFLLGFEKNYVREAADKSRSQKEYNPYIRFFDYPKAAFEGALKEFDFKAEGFWRGCSADDLPYFSAVGYYFAEDLQKDLQIPVGIVGCNWGGTPAVAWMDPARLVGTEGSVWLDDYEPYRERQSSPEFLQEYGKNLANNPGDPLSDKMGSMLLKHAVPKVLQKILMVLMKNSQDPEYPFERRPGGLYETMLKKIVPFSCRGVIWYQGETDGDNHPDQYTVVFSKLIENWRELWGEELPFLFVQLAPLDKWFVCDGRNYHGVRRCQQTVSETVPNTWMTSTSDCGMRWDIHPKNKLPVGRRLSLLARKHVYGEDITADAPKMSSASYRGNDLVIQLESARGLHIKGKKLAELAVVYENSDGEEQEKFIHAAVEGDTLVCKGIRNAKALRFAQRPYYEVNLYNDADIPALPAVLSLR